MGQGDEFYSTEYFDEMSVEEPLPNNSFLELFLIETFGLLKRINK